MPAGLHKFIYVFLLRASDAPSVVKEVFDSCHFRCNKNDFI